MLLIGLSSLSWVSAQTESSQWKLADVQSLADLIGDPYNSRVQPILSPDGSAVAWGDPDNGLNVFTLEDQQLTTYPWPENFKGYGPYSGLSWSPDSQYLTFTESLFDYALESDLWMLDRSSGEITDRTDDGIFGPWFNVNKSDELDYLPTWNPTNDDLYFFRSEGIPGQDITTGLYLLPAGRTEPKLVRDLTADVPPVISIFPTAAISPDGKQIAFFALANDLSDTRNGLWILDLKTGTPQQVAAIADFRTGLLATQEITGLLPEVPLWAGNDALVILATDHVYSNPGVGLMAYYVNLGDKTVTPVVNFSDVADVRTLFEDNGPQSPIFRVPRKGVVSMDGTTFFFLRYGFGSDHIDHAGISALPLPPDGSTPVELGDIDHFNITPAADAWPVMSADGKALMSGYLFQFEPA
jgi:hypothetical protein